jgi:hypothetical protein
MASAPTTPVPQQERKWRKWRKWLYGNDGQSFAAYQLTSTGPYIVTGSGDPTVNGITASAGSIYLREDGTDSSHVFYVYAPTGWAVK